MSTVEPSATAAPVGHLGVRVDITERPAVAVSGWSVSPTRTMSWVTIGRGSRISLGWLPVMTLGPVSTAVGRLVLAAKARVIGSDRRNGGSVNSKHGSTACRAVTQAS